MKKFFISSALFAALMFVVSCGDVSINAPSDPTTDPTANPTTNPTTEPTAEPTGEPTAEPTSDESDDNGFGGTGECEISDSYTDVSFDQYFRFKGTALVRCGARPAWKSHHGCLYRYDFDAPSQCGGRCCCCQVVATECPARIGF